tara:strand:- start:1073 stop:2389 length:1317 start_codon:yes stop_codon:yes gene_type:complete
MTFLGVFHMHTPNENLNSKINNLENLFKEGNMNIVIPQAIALIKEYNSGLACNILALANKRLGNYVLAQSIYEGLLTSNPENTLFLGNLGNIYTEIGKLEKAEECYTKALTIQPKQLNISVSLGNILASTGRLDDALVNFHTILKVHDEITPEQVDDINYRIAEIYRQKGVPFLDKAIQHYKRSNQPLSSAHRLELIYKSKDKATYCKEEKKINAKIELNPLLAAVQTHASIRYSMPDTNLFCKDPFKYIYHSKLTLNEGFNEDLVENLLNIKNSLSSIPQKLLNNGHQSAGNFLLSDDPSVQIIKNMILNRIKKYRNNHKSSTDGFINRWPTKSSLHGWIIDIKKGGGLESHMHKLGWLSGSLYLQLNKPTGSNQGNIKFDLNGADYPASPNVFPSKEFNIEKGDIILFPSSIFHKTVPFESEENRITLAFDVKPNY